VTAAVRLFDSGPLRLLPAAVREPRRAWLAILVGGALTLSGSLLLSSAASLLAPTLGKPDFPLRGAMAFGSLVLFAPLVETLIMAAVLSLLARFLSPTVAVLSSAALWGVAHSLQASVWGLVIWWPFVIFSTLYMVWRERSTWAAIGVVAATHALQNLVPGWTIAFA
jgi:membrane protease YdiL (CAAX protease family)